MAKKQTKAHTPPPFPLAEIALPLLFWYEQNKRDLPWRESPTPYHVWVSEIMLQQTRVETVKPYFARFIATLPTVKDLAEADEDTLLKLWEGLGYYSRVRNMQKAAKDICLRFGGNIPSEKEALLSLCGIGSYTAGAISAFAFGKPEPAVDGNVLRVVARLVADDRNVLEQKTKEDIEDALKQVVPPDFAGNFGQALIELGALVCLPSQAETKCQACPLSHLCQAKAQGLVSILPTRFQKQSKKSEEKTILLYSFNQKIYIRKRAKQGLLAGLWEFPHLEGSLSKEDVLAYLEAQNIKAAKLEVLPASKHIFTHLVWNMVGYHITLAAPPAFSDGLFVPISALKEEYAIPSAFSAYKKVCQSEDFMK